MVAGVVHSPGFVDETVAKKANPSGGRPSAGEPFNFRAPGDLIRRIKRIAVEYAVDPSAMVRIILAENIATYEKKAEQMRSDRERSQVSFPGEE